MLKNWFKRSEKVDPRHPKDPALAHMYGLRSGNINSHTAMTLTAVYAAVNIIAETIATLPLDLKQKTANGGSEPAIADSRYDLLTSEPNRYQTKYEFIEYVMQCYLLRGRSVSQIVSAPNGIITDLLPIHPDELEVMRLPNGRLVYKVKDRILLDSEVVDFRGVSYDGGITCISPIEQNSNTLNLAAHADKYASDFFANSTVMSGFLETKEPLSDKAYERIKVWWEKTKRESGRHSTPVLENGLTFKPVTVNPKDSQLIESRQYSVLDIARIYRVPPHKLGDLSRATFSNIEQQNLDFVNDSILPRLTRLEFALKRSLFTKDERKKLDIYFVLEALLRGDSQSRVGYYKGLWEMGAISPNEIRIKENMNPVDGGDKYTMQLNLTPVDKI
jgi:HK97 family phage portal protein